MTKKFFIVGCPRSGTTLLQAMLGANAEVFTLPESHFFRKSFRGRKAFFLRGYYASAVLRKWLKTVGQEKETNRVPRFTFARKPVVDAFVRIMDSLASEKDCTAWLEKTPGHVFVINHIEKYIPEAFFVHIVRDGRATVASLHDAAQKYPEVWRNHSLENSVTLWNKAIQESAKHTQKENHLFLSYERLTIQPKKTLQSICHFLGLEFDISMLDNYQTTAAEIILPGQDWVRNAQKELARFNLTKYQTILNEAEQEFVETNLIRLPDSLLRKTQND